VFERGTKAASGSTGETARTAVVLIRRKVEKGEALYLNLTPLAYAYFPHRSGKMGQAWREVMGKALRDAGLGPRVEIYSRGEQELWMESLLWRNANRYCLAVLKNVLGSADAPDAMKMIEQEPKEILIRLTLPVREVRNIRTEKSFGDVSSFNDRFNPWEASLYEFTVGR
jgi:hypothetical protein